VLFRSLIVISAVAASLLINAAAVLSADDYMGTWSAPQQSQQKDECLLVAKNCSNEILPLQQRIDHLNAEIAKGTDVYTVDELNVLNRKLDEANKAMDFMRNEGY
jgi:hypothetical protein